MPKKSKRSTKKKSVITTGAGLQRGRHVPPFAGCSVIAGVLISLVLVNCALSYSKDHGSKVHVPVTGETREEQLPGDGSKEELDSRSLRESFCLGEDEDLSAGRKSDQEIFFQTAQEERVIVSNGEGTVNELCASEDILDHEKSGDEGQLVVADTSHVEVGGEHSLDIMVLEEQEGADLCEASGVGNGKLGICLASGLRGNFFFPRCLVAVAVASKDVLPCIEDILAVDHSCDYQEEEADAGRSDPHDTGTSDDTVVLCFRNFFSGSVTCGSICNSPRDSLSGSRASVCLCGAALLHFLLVDPFHQRELHDLPEESEFILPVSEGQDDGKGSDAEGLASLGVNFQAYEGPVSPVQEAATRSCDADVLGIGVSANQSDLDILQSEETGDFLPASGVGLDGPLPLHVVKPVLDRLVGLDEFKKSKQQQVLSNVGDGSSAISHVARRASGDYNYAKAANGARIVGSSKEAKGANYILEKDKDKYLRIPCNAEDKFVVIRLSEETQVDVLVICNYEFYASNPKDFELLGSKIYPTDDWISLGKYQAENVRHPQKFTLTDSRPVRYLKLRMLTHYGSDFFCTLSMVEVYGVDEIASLLEGWIPVEDLDSGVKSQASGQEEGLAVDSSRSTANSPSHLAPSLPSSSVPSSPSQPPAAGETIDATLGQASDKVVKEPSISDNVSESASSSIAAAESVHEALHLLSRPSGDAVLKIVLQKVKSLELNQSLFDQYVEDLNMKIRDTFYKFGQELLVITEWLRNETSTAAALAEHLRQMERKVEIEGEVLDNIIASEFNRMATDYADLRLHITRMRNRETTAVILAIVATVISSVLLYTLRSHAADQGNRRGKPTPDFCRGLFYVVIMWNTTLIVFVLAA